MFGKLFGSKDPKKTKAKAKAAAPATPKAAPATKLKRVNVEKRFTIISECGVGSMSRVYKALDNQSGRVVCLKIQDRTKADAAAGRTSGSGRPPEGEVGMKIHHKNVVKTFDFGVTPKKEQFLTMEFIEGVSLVSIREGRSRDLAGKVELLLQAAEGLSAVHKAGYFHHDFGPKNVLVTRENVAKLIDFGLAIPDIPAFRRPGNRTGTLQYMAPEVLRREPKDKRLDVFSWGIMAFELLTNRMPYEATKDQMAMMRSRMNADPIDIAQVDPNLPDDLAAVIRKALARRPDDRWPSMEPIIAALLESPLIQREQ